MANAQAWRASAIIKMMAPAEARTSVCPMSRLRRMWPSPAMPGEYKAIRNWRLVAEPSDRATKPCSDSGKARSSGPRNCSLALIAALLRLWRFREFGSNYTARADHKADTRSEVIWKRLAVTGIAEEIKRSRADRIGDETDRAIDQADVEAARVGGAEQACAVAELCKVIRQRWAAGLADGVIVEAGRVTLVIVGLLAPEIAAIEAFFADHQGVRRAIGDRSERCGARLAYHAGSLLIAGGVIAEGVGNVAAGE